MDRIALVGKAVLAAFAIAAVGSVTWLALLETNLRIVPAVPWAALVMAAVLYLIWRYLGGSWWPAGTSEARRRLLRGRLVPARCFAWAAVAGALALVALAGLWIVLVRLTGAGGNPTITGIAALPALTVALTLVVASLVSPLTEEAAFRGYAQVLLERRLPPVAAVAVSSVLFAVWHGPTQGFAPSKLLFFFIVGAVFGTIACLTNSVLPAIPVHIAGDLLFFTAIWPHDATRTVIWAQGPDAWFWLSVAQTIVFAALAVLAFRRLAQWPMAARRD
jgi:membrane protease YdiL (CAAX protease family)